MSHYITIAQHKKILEQRFEILKLIREFFWQKNFIEVDTPLLIAVPGQEPNIRAMAVSLHDEKNNIFSVYLHTSPEYSMKKMLSAGFENIFFLGSCFRDYESFTGLHNPEFSMLEFYRVNTDMFGIMKDVEKLYNFLYTNINNEHKDLSVHIERIHMRDVWEEYVQVNLDEYLTVDAMRKLCRTCGFVVDNNERYEELFYRIFLRDIEPCLKKRGMVFLHHYPAQMASLSELSADDPRYADRFECYIDGVELANGFTELCNSEEQLHRLEYEQTQRKKSGYDVYPIDTDFIEAVSVLPVCSGVALGVDRLIMSLLGCESIDDVRILSARLLFQ